MYFKLWMLLQFIHTETKSKNLYTVKYTMCLGYTPVFPSHKQGARTEVKAARIQIGAHVGSQEYKARI